MKTKSISTNKAPKAVGPYSQGIKTSNLIFTSGQLPIIPETGELIKGDIKRETRLCLDNLLAVVEEGGAKLKDIVKVNIYIKDMNDFPLINEEYEDFFQEHKPARSCVQVAKLPKDGNIEIEAIAVL
ncbi:RidA family protein [Schnuerera sp.]|uniref:RidA family protein n=1 Tax=Schnuerera sp. TaxID=2794844 RepID=UPI002C4EB1DA|nr:RidA family protein [Schnuerera sp.]HSH36808.1 RidA family protein [Schnuerera sp.]